MPKTLFTIDTLGDLDDGTTRLLVDQALAEALEDCNERPYLDKARKVTVTLEMRPALNERGGMKGVNADATVKLTLPARRSGADYLATNAAGGTVEAFLPSERPAPLFTTEEGN